MKKALAFIGLFLLAFVAFPQDDEEVRYRANFVEATLLMEEHNYEVALEEWLELVAAHNTSNVNYKIGLCYWMIPKQKEKALPYFQKAVKDVDDRYDPFSPGEESAPREAYFYIANSYHLDYQLDSAIHYYNVFKNHINHNHEFWARTDLEIEMCNNAKAAILNPVDIEVINLGPLVNSRYPDYAPIISIDESAIYFTSKRLRKDSSNLYTKNDADGHFYEDIYVSYKGADGAWNEAEPLNFNTSNNEATLSLSADGETMYVYKTGEKGYGDLYESKLVGDIWSDPVLLGSDINTNGHETHAAVSPDGRRLYFISNRDGSMRFPDKAHEKVNSKDIYFCNLLPTGEWALAQPLTELNTPYHEDGVFLHPDGKTMYLSSEGHGSIGGYDIFVSTFQEDSTWSKPENIGYPINSTDDDVFFVTSASGKRSYYSSIRDEGFGEKDVYVISMLSFQEKPLTLLIGEIIASEGQQVPEGIFIYVTDNETGEEVGTFKPRSRDNKFTIIIPPGSDYHLNYTLDDSTFYEDDIFVPYNSTYQEINKGINMGAIDFSSGKPSGDASSTSATDVKSGPEEPTVQGTLKYGGAGAVGVVVNLQDDQKNRIAQSTTDGSGNFEFAALAPGSKYFVQIDPDENGTIPDDAQLYMKDAKTGAMLPVSKLGTGIFAFETLPYLTPDELELEKEQDGDGGTILIAGGDDGKGDGKTDTKDDTRPPAYKTEVQEVDGEKVIIHEVQPGETMYRISLMYNLKLDAVLNANPGKNELIYPGDQIKLPIPTDVQFFQEFFDYNVTDIKMDLQDYQNFLAQVEKVVSEKGKATLMIESSSSKVPSAKFNGNKNLSIKRAESAKELLTKSMAERNVSSDKLVFADMSTLVRGPEYNNDAQENKATYKNYQYIKIIVK